jgi:hypothetical protein
MVDGFLGRWSQRKQAERAGLPLDEPTALAPPTVVVHQHDKQDDKQDDKQEVSQAAKPAGSASAAPDPAAPAPAAELPSLEDAARLSTESDFRPYMSRGVAPEVRNAAMKKLFADPHFNVMDRLDIYIDDYSLPDPLPASMLRQMASAQFLKLFDDDNEAETPQSPEPDHDHTDLRLQPNHAAGQGEPGGGAQRDADAA